MHKFNIGERVFNRTIGVGEVLSVSDLKNNITYVVRAFNDVYNLPGNIKKLAECKLERAK